VAGIRRGAQPEGGEVSRETTLLEDLREAEADALVRGHTSLALRLRAHAARLREEMERANTRWTGSTSMVCRGLLERVNGGPL